MWHVSAIISNSMQHFIAGFAPTPSIHTLTSANILTINSPVCTKHFSVTYASFRYLIHLYASKSCFIRLLKFILWNNRIKCNVPTQVPRVHSCYVSIIWRKKGTTLIWAEEESNTTFFYKNKIGHNDPQLTELLLVWREAHILVVPGIILVIRFLVSVFLCVAH